MTLHADAASLLRSVGLMADGPVLWGRQVPASGPGVFVIESSTPLPSAPIEMTFAAQSTPLAANAVARFAFSPASRSSV